MKTSLLTVFIHPICYLSSFRSERFDVLTVKDGGERVILPLSLHKEHWVGQGEEDKHLLGIGPWSGLGFDSLRRPTKHYLSF